MEYRIYIFPANYRYLKDIYKKDIDIQFDNIKTYLKNELEGTDAVTETEDHRSLQLKSRDKNDFKSIFGLAEKADNVINSLMHLFKDLDNEIIIKTGIMLKEEDSKKHPFIWNMPLESAKKTPGVLISDKTALSILENYEVKAVPLRNIWTTDGIEYSRSRKIKNIYFDREETENIVEFIEGRDKVLFIYGEKGSGKTTIVKDFIKNYGDSGNTVFLDEKKHTPKEFRSVHDLLYRILFYSGADEADSTDDAVRRIGNSNLPGINKNNLIFFCKNLFSENGEKEKTFMDYGTYRQNIRRALNDALRISRKSLIITVDNHQWMSKNCEEILLDAVKEEYGTNKLIFVTDDKNDTCISGHPVSLLKISDLNKVQVSKILKLSFPRAKISTKTADFIHRATGGNLYTVLEFVQYMLDRECLVSNEGKLEVSIKDLKTMPDNLLDMYSEKISRLSANALTLLKIISVIGDRFFLSDLDWLLHILNYPSDESAALAELDEKGIIENMGDHYFISEPSAVTELYKTMNPNNRKLIHKLLAELFETKGFDEFGFKIFVHYYRSESYEKLISILPELLDNAYQNLNFNALKNMLEISDRLLFRLCVKEQVFPMDIWVKNLSGFRLLFDPRDPLGTILVFEKAIDHLIKIEKNEYCLPLVEMLLNIYMNCGKKKKFDQYLNTGMELSKDVPEVRFRMLVLSAASKLSAGKNISPEELNTIENAAHSVPGSEEYHYYMLLKATGLEIEGRYQDSVEFLKNILQRQLEITDFSGISSTLEKLTGLYMRTRDHKSAEENLKQLIILKKESSPETTHELNLLLARIYSYQNKFLQSISMLESLILQAGDSALYFELNSTLGSIYQFYNEKEMAYKTFDALGEKIKNCRSENYLNLNLKSALVRSFFHEYEDAAKILENIPKDPLAAVIGDIISFAQVRPEEKETDRVFKELTGKNLHPDRDIMFETCLLFLNVLSAKRKTEKCKHLIKYMSDKQSEIDDFNMVLNFQKISKDIIKKSNKPVKKLSEPRSMSVSVRKRVSRRRTL